MSAEPDLADGSAATVAALYDRHASAVLRFALSIVRDPDLAQDVVQEVFVLAWRKRRAVVLVDGSALPWLLTTARLTSLAMLRKEARRRHAPLLDEDLPAADERDDALRDAVAALPAPDRAVVELVLVDGLTYAEAAERLGLSVAAAGKRLQRAKARLRTELRPERNPS